MKQRKEGGGGVLTGTACKWAVTGLPLARVLAAGGTGSTTRVRTGVQATRVRATRVLGGSTHKLGSRTVEINPASEQGRATRDGRRRGRPPSQYARCSTRTGLLGVLGRWGAGGLASGGCGPRRGGREGLWVSGTGSLSRGLWHWSVLLFFLLLLGEQGSCPGSSSRRVRAYLCIRPSAACSRIMNDQSFFSFSAFFFKNNDAPCSSQPPAGVQS